MKTIDIEKIVRARKGGDKIPGFVLRWLKKFIHQDFINAYLEQGYMGGEFCHHCLEYLDIKMEVEGLENLDLVPEGKHITMASNHPLGGVDGVAMLGVMYDRYKDNIRLMVNDFLMNIEGIAPVCIPINKIGGQARGLADTINEAYESENEMLIFPAGICSRKQKDGTIQDKEWKKNFIQQSVRTGRYIIPVHFIARNSDRFYRVTKISDRLKMKFNPAMAFLPDELYRAQHKTFKVIIGKPIAPETFDSSRRPQEWAQWVREQAYGL